MCNFSGLRRANGSSQTTDVGGAMCFLSMLSRLCDSGTGLLVFIKVKLFFSLTEGLIKAGGGVNPCLR